MAMLKERAQEMGQKYRRLVEEQRLYPQNVPLYLVLVIGWLWRQLETGGTSAYHKIRRDVDRKKKLFHERRDLFLRHYLLILIFYIVRLYLFVLLSLLAFLPIPVPDISNFGWEKYYRFVRNIPAPRELFQKVWNVLSPQKIYEKLRSFLSPSDMVKAIRAVPAGVQQIWNKLAEFLLQRWKSFKVFLKRLRTPKRAYAHFLAVVRKAFRNRKRIRREIISAIFSAVLLRLAIIYLLPIVSVGIVSLIGANFLVIAVFAIQSAIPKIAGFLARPVSRRMDRVIPWFGKRNHRRAREQET